MVEHVQSACGLRLAPAHDDGLTSGETVIVSKSSLPPRGYTSLSSGDLSRVRKTRSARAMPSIQRRSVLSQLSSQYAMADIWRAILVHLFAGTSILSC